MSVSNRGLNVSAGGVGFFPLLFLIFLTLRLCGVIDWSWWLVTLPLWGPLACVLLFILFAGAGLMGYAVVVALLQRK